MYAKLLLPLLFTNLLMIGGQAWSATITSVSNPVEFHKTKYFFDIYESSDKTPKPAVVIIPEYWGKDELEAVQAKKLAEAGYVVLVMDLYGNGQHTKKSQEAGALAKKAEAQGFGPLYDLFTEAVKILRARKDVDPKHIGVIGYGYGGGISTNIAKRARENLTVAVSFYGGLKNIQTLNMIGKKPAVLYFHPKHDSYSFDNEIKAFESKMSGAKVEVKIVNLEDGHYGFVHQGIESYGGDEGNTLMFYNKKMADESWQILLDFLKKNI